MARTGFSPQVRTVILEREGGRCAIGGEVLGDDAQVHHRRPRGLGGARRISTNQPSNGLACCDEHHRYIESNRTEAYRNGWLVEQVCEAALTKVLYRGEWVRLGDDGCIYPIDEDLGVAAR